VRTSVRADQPRSVRKHSIPSDLYSRYSLNCSEIPKIVYAENFTWFFRCSYARKNRRENRETNEGNARERRRSIPSARKKKSLRTKLQKKKKPSRTLHASSIKRFTQYIRNVNNCAR